MALACQVEIKLASAQGLLSSFASRLLEYFRLDQEVIRSGCRM